MSVHSDEMARRYAEIQDALPNRCTVCGRPCEVYGVCRGCEISGQWRNVHEWYVHPDAAKFYGMETDENGLYGPENWKSPWEGK